MCRGRVPEAEAMATRIKKTVPEWGSKGLQCPICGEAAAQPASAGGKSPRPFCSTRCAEVDLGRWFQGQYAIPTVDACDDTIVGALIAEAKATAGRREE